MSPVPIRVLIVEDDAEDFRYISFLLTKNTFATYELEWAGNYADGLKTLKKRAHDVALFDYHLGGATGLDLLHDARKQGYDIPVILLTGYDNPEIDEEASKAGAEDYLCKMGLTHVQLERSIRYAVRHGATLSALRKSQNQLELFLKNVPCAVCVRDRAGEMIFQNELFTRSLTGTKFDAGRDRKNQEASWTFEHNGRYWQLNWFPMVDAQGTELEGFAATEITARVLSEHERDRQSRLLNSLLKNLPVVAGRLDGNGRIVEAQGRGFAPHGLTEKKLLGKSFRQAFPRSDAAVEQALKGESVGFSVKGGAGDAEWYGEFYLSADRDETAGITFFGRDVTERRWLEQRLLTVTEAEQRRIGADLHDSLGQHLTGLACIATAVRDQLKNRGIDLAQQADLISKLSNDAIVQAQALARGLCPVQVDHTGLNVALGDMAYKIKLLHGVDCEFHSRGPAPESDQFTATHVYRIAQEAINNAIRHGGATRIRLRMASARGVNRLTITDNGKGFDPSAKRRTPASGLRLMAYRTSMIGGNFSVSAKPKRGTRIKCTFPDTPSS